MSPAREAALEAVVKAARWWISDSGRLSSFRLIAGSHGFKKEFASAVLVHTNALDALDALPLEPAQRKVPCESASARWCPNCGTCSCGPEHDACLGGDECLCYPACPLHGQESRHAEEPEIPLADRLEAAIRAALRGSRDGFMAADAACRAVREELER